MQTIHTDLVQQTIIAFSILLCPPPTGLLHPQLPLPDSPGALQPAATDHRQGTR